jgi:hypothetical protein
MAYTVSLPTAQLDELRETISNRALPAVRALHDGLRAEHARIAKNSEHLPDALVRERRENARLKASAAMHGHVADAEAWRQVHARAARELGLDWSDRDARESPERLGRSARYVAQRAAFLPPISGDATAQAHDLRVLADEARRSAYARQLARMDVHALADELQGIVELPGAEYERADALARLAELDAHAAGLQGPDAGKLRGSVAGAWARVGERWPMLGAMHKQLNVTAQDLDELVQREESVRINKESALQSYFDHRARKAA